MANFIITSGTNSFTFEMNGSKFEFNSGDLKPAIPQNGNDRILKIKDTSSVIDSIGTIESEIIKIDLDIDTVDVDGTTTFANADELFLALKPIFFLTNGSSSGNGWDDQVADRNALPITVPPSAGAIYLAENPVIVFGVYRQYQSGLYIRQTENGNLSDWRRLNVKVKFTSAEFRVVDSTDQTKQLGLDASGLASGQTRIWTAQNKDIVVAGLDDIPVNSVFGRQGAVVAQNDDYLTDQIQIRTLDSSYYDFNFTGYGSLRSGKYQFQTSGVNLANTPFDINASAIYKVRIDVNNDSWHSVELDFSTQGDFLNQNRKFYRSGQTFVAALGIGWNERILQPQYERLTSLEVLNNNPRLGQTTEGLINNTNVTETYLDQQFTPRRTGNFTCQSFMFWSLNDGGQDLIANLQIFQGATLVGGIPQPMRVEPKDTGAAGVTLNLLSGGLIVGNANTSTNQRHPENLEFDVDLLAGTVYNLLLTWQGSANGDLAAIYSGKTSIKENLL